jgi:ELWxxDGT repeat protein
VLLQSTHVSPRLPLALFVHLISAAAFAAGPLTPWLVKDLTPGHRLEAVRPHPFWTRTLGEVVFFGASGARSGLWRTDGTAAGTHRIYDAFSGFDFPWHAPVERDGALHYPVYSRTGTWLTRTDGTTPGTAKIANIPGWFGGALCGGRKICFGTEGSRAAVTDGTAAGTVIFGSSASDYETNLPRHMTALGDRVFFNAYDETNGLCMWVPAGLGRRQICGELWTSDGTAAGTRLFIDLNPGGAPSAPENLFASSAGKLYFAANDPGGEEAHAWVSDGTPEGTRVISPKRSNWLIPPYFHESNGRVFFNTSDGDLFVTDGTPEGTHSLRDPLGLPVQVILEYAGTVGARTLLLADDQLWAYTGDELSKVADLPSGRAVIGYLASTQRFYFVTGHSHFAAPLELWSTDGTPAGTQKLGPVPRGRGTVTAFAATPTRLFYLSGQGLYVTDGTAAGTSEIVLDVSVAKSSYVQMKKAVGDKAFFTIPGAMGATDGTADGTVILTDSGVDPFTHEGHTYFYEEARLYKTDGTAAGTIQASQWLGVTTTPYVTPPAFIGATAIFAAGSPDQQLMRRGAGGAAEPLGLFGGFSFFTGIGQGVVFAFYGGESEHSVMFTDGTAAGTTTLLPRVGSVGRFTRVGNSAMFGATAEDSTALQLWITDGTAAGTRVVKELAHDDSYPEIYPVMAWRDLFLFSTDSARYGLWRSDGTAEGTFPLTGERFEHILVDGDQLTLVRFTYPGYEVWTSDGTVAGTKKRDDFATGQPAGEPFLMSGGGVGVIYTADAGEVHIRNTRTQQVSVIQADVVALSPAVAAGGRVFFPGYRGATGAELWAVSLNGTAPPSPPAAVRVDYRGTAAIPGGSGAVFVVKMATVGASAPTVVAATIDGTLTGQRDYVPFSREIVFAGDDEVTLVVPLRHADAHGTMSLMLSAPVNAGIEQAFATATIGVTGKRRAARH